MIFTSIALCYVGSTDKIKSVLKSIIFLLIAESFYQGVVSFYGIIALLLIYLECKGVLSKKSIIASLSQVAVVAISGLANMMSMRILQHFNIAPITGRTASVGLSQIFQNIIEVFKQFDIVLLKSYGLIPSKLYFLAASLLIIIISRGLFMLGQRYNRLCYFFILLIWCLICSFIPHLLTSSIWMPQRTVVGVWILLGGIGIISSYTYGKNIERKIAIMILISVLLINVWGIYNISVDTISTNRMDEEFAYSVQNKIEEYELSTGKIIKGIATISDTTPTWSYRSTKCLAPDTNIRASMTMWSSVNSINFYNGTTYEEISVSNEEYEEIVGTNNWDYLNIDEQLVFIEDILYIIAY